MAIGISPTVDFAFKLVLGSPEHPAVTIHFLNAVLADQPKITEVEILNPFLGKEDEYDKLAVLDIRAQDEQSRSFNIEMQTTLPAGMSQRLTYYTSSLYSKQIAEGDRYTQLRPAISICVLTKAMFPQIPGLHLDFRLREATGQVFTNDLQIHLLELPKLRVTRDNVYHAPVAERWAYFLRDADKLSPDDIAKLFPDREFMEAAGVLEMISQTPEQKFLYEAREKFKRDEAARLEYAREEGEAKGREAGRQEGLRKGELFGQIKLLQKFLGVAESPREELTGLDEVQLSELVDQLQSQLRSRRQ